MKKNKGFTLVELLSVIIILGILMTLAYSTISKYLDQGYKTTYKDFEKNLTTGAANYLVDHSASIPNTNNKLVIDASKLICDGYVKQLKDPKDESKTCNLESYVIITRKNNVSYNLDIDYQVCLKCTNYQSSACTTNISGLERLSKDSSCEVK